jgi:flagellar basal-body rod protein FlgG
MNSGMYAALSGSMVSLQRMETLTNNLANLNTAGYKKDRMAFESVLANVDATPPPAAVLERTPLHSGVRIVTDHTAGSIRQTGATLDFALDGDGYFVVKTPQGKAYTRQGNFHVDAAGKLLTAQGDEVLGNGGTITITGSKIEVDSKGAILVDGIQVSVLDVVDFPKPYTLQKAGGALFTDEGGVGGVPTKTTSVRQGHLEDSNVNSILEMANLIETTRYYESCLKAVRSYDDMAAKATNELGKL